MKKAHLIRHTLPEFSGGIMATFLQGINGNWYKPDYAEIITLYSGNGIFTLTGGRINAQYA